MKKFIPFLFVFLFFASCEKDPDLDKVRNEYVTYTQYDKATSFNKGSSFFIADKVLAISSESKESYLDAALGDFIIDAFISNMTSRGFSRVLDKNVASFGLQVSFLESTFYFQSNPSWWYNYPYYWSPNYWGPWYGGGWYYPYPFIYSYSTGSLICEMVDLSTVSTQSSSNKLPVVWNCYITGLLSGNNKISEANTVQAISQAFAQSSYLKYSK